MTQSDVVAKEPKRKKNLNEKIGIMETKKEEQKDPKRQLNKQGIRKELNGVAKKEIRKDGVVEGPTDEGKIQKKERSDKKIKKQKDLKKALEIESVACLGASVDEEAAKPSAKATKRRERAKRKKNAEATEQRSSPSLSAEGLAMLQEISAKGEAARTGGLRTGKISMTELMGDKKLQNDLQRLRLATVDPELLLQVALSKMPTEAADLGVPRAARLSPVHLLPWVNFSPMYPIDSRQKPNAQMLNHGPGASFYTSHMPTSSQGISGYPRTVPPNSNPPFSPVRSSSGLPTSMQAQNRGRKPFFLPYYAPEAIGRGLATGELVKGSLRVNQRNYEESYIDNPDGDEQADLLILGIHDRNRALHGDVVVVRVKGREDWAVRDNLYTAWREGKLNELTDDDGKPITIPPVPHVDEPIHMQMLNGLVHSGDVAPSELSRTVAQNPELEYDRKSMLLIASQSCGEGASSSSLQSSFADMGISKASSSEETASNNSPLPVPKKTRLPGQNMRRSNVKLLNELPSEDWGIPDVCLQKTAEVVFIEQAKHCRVAMGQLKVMADGNRNWALFSPTDSRMPRMLIPFDQLPMGFFDRPHDYQRFIFVARMEEWAPTAQFARGKLERTLGEMGDIDAETEGLLIENNIDTREFSSAALSSLPISESSEWKIDEKEFKYRKDLRDRVIFTIDPATARDLDDALMIDPCDDVDGQGTPGFEVGVHIADVSHFLLENTELDKWASQRATSVYLVHKVIPMLPRILCEELCSLNPGVDRLAFSVIWKMDADANIKEQWMGRTIIRSCIKMAYNHAQDIIDNPEKEFGEGELPLIYNEKRQEEVKQKVLLLHDVAKKLHKRRFENGSLRLDQPKMKFALDDETKLPYGVTFDEKREANSLVEEFMLLANMSVAEHIEKKFPDISLLRCHPPPKKKLMKDQLELCTKIGFPLDGTSSAFLSSSLRKFEGNKRVQTAVNQVLSTFMMKAMQLAQYFCTGTVTSKDRYHHYALSVNYYTHFTSPIRRYADVLVHRVLAACCGYAPPPSLTPSEVQKQAQHCNEKKADAKNCSEESAETFFGLFVKEAGPLVEKGVVVNVLDAAFDVLVLKYGVTKRVYVNRLDMAREPKLEGSPAELTLFWTPTCGESKAPIEQVIRTCSVVEVVLSALPEPTKYQAIIKMCPRSEQKTLHDLAEEYE